jgi:hypothetical protein
VFLLRKGLAHFAGFDNVDGRDDEGGLVLNNSAKVLKLYLGTTFGDVDIVVCVFILKYI